MYMFLFFSFCCWCHSWLLSGRGPLFVSEIFLVFFGAGVTRAGGLHHWHIRYKISVVWWVDIGYCRWGLDGLRLPVFSGVNSWLLSSCESNSQQSLQGCCLPNIYGGCQCHSLPWAENSATGVISLCRGNGGDKEISQVVDFWDS